MRNRQYLPVYLAEGSPGISQDAFLKKMIRRVLEVGGPPVALVVVGIIFIATFTLAGVHHVDAR